MKSPKILIAIILVFLLIFLAKAETTFFDNPDDVFIMSNLYSAEGTPEAVSEIIGGTTSHSSCLYNWNCTEWSKCFLSMEQTRTCINTGTCPDNYNPPSTKQNCTLNVMTGEIISKRIIGENTILIYFILILTILYLVSYLEKDYLKKIFKR